MSFDRRKFRAVLFGVAGALFAFGATETARAGAIGEPFPMSATSLPGLPTSDLALSPSTGGYLFVGLDSWNGRLNGQQYDAQGRPTGNPFEISSDYTPDYSPTILMERGGQFTVVWKLPAKEPGLRCARFDADGTPLGGDVTLPVGLPVRYRIDRDAAGRFAVVYSNYESYFRFYYFQRFSASGEPLGEPVPISPPSADEYIHSSSWMEPIPFLAINDRGDAVVAWDAGKSVNWAGNDVYVGNLYAQRFDPSGKPVGGTIALTSDTDKSQDLHGLTLDEEGNFGVFWDRQEWSPEGYIEGQKIFGQMRKADGSILKATFPLDPAPSPAPSPPGGTYPQLICKVVPDRDGYFVVVWMRSGGMTGRWFGPDGTPHGGPFKIDSEDYGQHPDWTFGDGDGNLLTFWYERSKENPGWITGKVLGQRFAFGTATTLHTSPGPAPAGEFLTLTAEVRSAPGAEVPTGRVTFKDAGKVLGVLPLDADGRATFITRSLKPGTHAVTAEYHSDGTYFDSAGELEGGLKVLLASDSPPGDLDWDGLVGVEDAVTLLRGLAGAGDLTLEQAAVADVNGDGALDVADVVRIMRLSVGLPLENITPQGGAS